MPTIKIPTPLRAYTSGQAEVQVNGATPGEALQSLVTQFPPLKQHLYNGESLRPFVNLFLGQDNIKDLQGLETPLPPDAQLRLIPSIAGGTLGLLASCATLAYRTSGHRIEESV
ncbi:MAG: MoaD/ThiS family protein [Chloroflexota bacterium]